MSDGPVIKLLGYDELNSRVQDPSFALDPYLLTIPWVAVARGGLPFATMLGIKYNVRFGVIDPYLEEVYLTSSGYEYLLIDDVIGTGRTYRKCQELMPNCKLRLCLVVDDPTKDIRPDAAVFTTSDWVSLPWEPNGH